MTESALLAAIGRWMPLGAITILAAYCLTTINVTTPPRHPRGHRRRSHHRHPLVAP